MNSPGSALQWRETRKRHDAVTIPTIWIAAILSLLVHIAALLLVIPRLERLLPPGGTSAPDVLAVQIAPPSLPSPPPPPQPSAPPPAPAPAPPAPPPPAKAPRPRVITPRKPTPPVIAVPKGTPNAQPLPVPVPVPAPAPEPQPAPPPPPIVPPPAPAAPPAQDLAAYIDARRRARGEPPAAAASPSAEQTEEQRRQQIIAANTGIPQTPTFGRDPRNAGGIFEIREIGYDYAQFSFFGFDKDIRRRASQLIEVRKGSNSDIRIAVVRRMIEIIRENVNDQFEWISRRLGRQVTLSARPADNAELEDFLMRDVFPEGRSQ